MCDGAAGFFLPLPDSVEKCLATQVVTCLAFLVDLTFNQHLRGNAGMIATGLPQGLVAEHAMVANQGIHDSVLKRMSHMQRARYIGRGDHDAVGFAISLRSEITALFPDVVPTLFDGFRVVCLVHRDSVLLQLRVGAVLVAQVTSPYEGALTNGNADWPVLSV